jgi:hypothetical protein
MKTPAFILTENSLTVSVEGKTYTINSGHPSWKQAIESLKRKDYQALKDLVSVQKAFCSFTGDKVKIVDNQVFFNGEPINSYLSEKILSFMEKGLPHESLIKFLERLMANPSRRAVTELYSFLRHKSLPITDDGTFLAYKSVRSDYTDHHTGNFNNSIGNTLQMTRNNVCDDHNQGCSIGFHAGSLEYASSFGGADSVLLIVEIDPADVVSVPSDCECQKLRTCKYKVVAKYDGPLPEHYTKDAQSAYDPQDDSDDEEHDDDSDWDGDKESDDESEEQVSITVQVGNKSHKFFVRDPKGRFAKSE